MAAPRFEAFDSGVARTPAKARTAGWPPARRVQRMADRVRAQGRAVRVPASRFLKLAPWGWEPTPARHAWAWMLARRSLRRWW